MKPLFDLNNETVSIISIVFINETVSAALDKKTYATSDIAVNAGFNHGIGQLTKRRDDLPTGMPSFSSNMKYTPSLNLNYKAVILINQVFEHLFDLFR